MLEGGEPPEGIINIQPVVFDGKEKLCCRFLLPVKGFDFCWQGHLGLAGAWRCRSNPPCRFPSPRCRPGSEKPCAGLVITAICPGQG